MVFHGIEKLSLVDFDGHTACTLFTGACNFRCPFCHNASLVLDPGSVPALDTEMLKAYLEKRRGLIDAVCFILWVHLSLTAVILFGYICGRISNANWRLTPIIGSSVMSTVAIFREWLDGIFPKKSTDEAENNENCNEKRVCLRLGVILSAVIVMFGAVNFNEIRKMPRDYEHPLEAVANDLEAHGLEYGYATFWRSQALTMLSDSKVRVRETLVKSDGVITDYYQSSRLWYEDQPGIDKYFIMLSDDELNTVGDSEYWQEITEKYLIENFETRGYNVFVFSRNVILKGTFGS